jgi:hypothetical protein
MAKTPKTHADVAALREEAPKPFDSIGFIMAFEAGEATEDEIIEGFQALIDNGMAWSLQGSYGRAAKQLIDQGLCAPGPKR